MSLEQEQRGIKGTRLGRIFFTANGKLKPWSFIVLVILAIIVILGLVRVGYAFDWTGFNAAGNPSTPGYQPAKTLWDWMQLIIVSAVLAAIGYGVTTRQAQQEHRRTEHEKELAADQERATVLDAYFDKMTELLLKEQLRASKADAEVRQVARARTLAALSRLDGGRKGTLVAFLHQAQLIVIGEEEDKKAPIIDLNQADLSGADLNGADLSHAFLSGAYLNQADLSRADLSYADLSYTFLSGADLISTNLNGANLSYAYLSRANLSRANLSKIKIPGLKFGEDTDLNGANLRQADLSGADLSYAILKDVQGVTPEKLASQAKSLEGATLPDEPPATDSAEEALQEGATPDASQDETTATSPTGSTEEELPTS